MEAPANAVRTRTCLLWEDRVIRGQFLRGAEVTLDDARENIAATAKLTGGRRRAVLIDLRGIRTQSAEARAYLAGPEATKITLAVALWIASPISRALGNFFLGFNRPETPARLFTDEASAVEWLVSFEKPA